MISPAPLFNVRSMTTTGLVDLHRIFSTIGLYDRNRTSNESSSLNDTSLDRNPYISNSSASVGRHSLEDDDTGGGEAHSHAVTSVRVLFKWYALIAILSVLVLTGIVFAVCRLSLKAEAFRKSGLNTHQDGLLFSDYQGSGLPISMDLDDTNDL